MSAGASQEGKISTSKIIPAKILARMCFEKVMIRLRFELMRISWTKKRDIQHKKKLGKDSVYRTSARSCIKRPLLRALVNGETPNSQGAFTHMSASPQCFTRIFHSAAVAKPMCKVAAKLAAPTAKWIIWLSDSSPMSSYQGV